MARYARDFGLILEGRSDNAVIKQILYSFFENPNLKINGIVPPQDATDAALSKLPAGWGNVKAHLENEDDFFSNFETAQYIVIQIDSDCSAEYGVPHHNPAEGREKTVEELVRDITAQMITWIGPNNYELVRDRVIFAVSVHEIECWLLPIYFLNEKAKRGKTKGCTSTLNTVLSDREGFYIDGKNYDHYATMAEHYKKRKDLMRLGPSNPSLAIFLNSLEKYCKDVPPQSRIGDSV